MPSPTTESWRPIPGFPGYEVSSRARVRSWRGDPDRSGPARILRPKTWHGMPHYVLAGEDVSLGVLMEDAYGAGAPYTTDDLWRTLPADVVEEIRTLEGVKSRFDVAVEFRIEPGRVVQLWESVPWA